MRLDPEASAIEIFEKMSKSDREIYGSPKFLLEKDSYEDLPAFLLHHCLNEDPSQVYPTDRHGNRYGWGWALLTTPEHLFSPAACQCPRTPEESLERLLTHLRKLLPQATEKQLVKLIG